MSTYQGVKQKEVYLGEITQNTCFYFHFAASGCHLGQFRLDIRRKLFASKMVQHCNRAWERQGELHPWDLQHRAGQSYGWAYPLLQPCFKREVGLDGGQRSLSATLSPPESTVRQNATPTLCLSQQSYSRSEFVALAISFSGTSSRGERCIPASCSHITDVTVLSVYHFGIFADVSYISRKGRDWLIGIADRSWLSLESFGLAKEYLID